ncbi:MAG: hypothetical protein Q4F71_00055 [Paracoccus sp. (in: a-proteobacteria)]|nr:hypothetical protein [Paracoccus sp. (in: a-proteobacteria)]
MSKHLADRRNEAPLSRKTELFLDQDRDGAPSGSTMQVIRRPREASAARVREYARIARGHQS